MARPQPYSARITPTLDLAKIEIQLSMHAPPVVLLKGKVATADPRIGRYSDVQMTFQYLPPSALTFIEDMKKALAANQEKT